MDAAKTINEILDYFQSANTSPGGEWALPDDGSSLCLDFRGVDDTVFWIDIERDGSIRVVWRPKNGPSRSMTFVHQQVEKTE